MDEMERDLLDLEPGERLEKGRPSFLSGLCITTWAGCGLLFILYSWQVLAAFWLDSGISDDSLLFIYINLALLGLTAFGAVGMWKLRRWGFFVYLVAELVPVGLSIYDLYDITGVLGMTFLDVLTESMFSFSGIITYWIPFIFIILYANHYKFLR